MGLNKATRETGKLIFKDLIPKDKIKKYWEVSKRTAINGLMQEGGMIEQDLKEIIEENDLKTTKPTEKEENKSGNTTQKEQSATKGEEK